MGRGHLSTTGYSHRTACFSASRLPGSSFCRCSTGRLPSTTSASKPISHQACSRRYVRFSCAYNFQQVLAPASLCPLSHSCLFLQALRLTPSYRLSTTRGTTSTKTRARLTRSAESYSSSSLAKPLFICPYALKCAQPAYRTLVVIETFPFYV